MSFAGVKGTLAPLGCTGMQANTLSRAALVHLPAPGAAGCGARNCTANRWCCWAMRRMLSPLWAGRVPMRRFRQGFFKLRRVLMIPLACDFAGQNNNCCQWLVDGVVLYIYIYSLSKLAGWLPA